MNIESVAPPAPVRLQDNLARYSLFDALRNRRSRRFGLGMKIPDGPFAYASRHAPRPLSEDEEAALAFAAAGITGYPLADLSYGFAQGGSMLNGMLGRTIGASDAINSVSLVVTNDTGTFFLKRAEDFSRAEISELVALVKTGDLAGIYRRSRIKISDKRAAPPLEPAFNFDINKWSLYAPGSTYFLPVSELTGLYVNALLGAFDEGMGNFVLDERANYQPAGLARFARSKGGHLEDDLRANRTITILFIETVVQEFVAVQQGMIAQNLALMAEALGLGGFPNYANHPYIWFKELGFRMGEMPGTKFYAMNPLVTLGLRVTRRDQMVSYPLGLERENRALLKAYCPPYYATMSDAVRAVVANKFGAEGSFRGGANASSWRDPKTVATGIQAPSESAISATIAYCEYVYARYGRFPAYSAPFKTTIGFQTAHLDTEFYERFYKPEALTDAHRRHDADWHTD